MTHVSFFIELMLGHIFTSALVNVASGHVFSGMKWSDVYVVIRILQQRYRNANNSNFGYGMCFGLSTFCIDIGNAITEDIIKPATYLYIAKKAIYDNARLICKKRGLDLVKVTSREVQRDLNNIYKRQKKSKCAWLGLHVYGKRFSYLDGTELRYTNWNINDGEPDDLKKDKCGCLLRKKLMWHSRRCTIKYHSLCGPSQPDGGMIRSAKGVYKVTIFSYKRWLQDADITRYPTYVVPQTSLRSCAKDSAILKCHYFSLDGKQCKMYTDDANLETQFNKGSTIWKRN